ncbi:unnamed protein product [Mytilus coruscus]|uniref:Uncharacterized protein n=1 Tax=Mytilus coruscus TaxID=42192 RepID=A0A6J8B651_MYTCO|nr:unnamed protein product [Mytilus coruscus]
MSYYQSVQPILQDYLNSLPEGLNVSHQTRTVPSGHFFILHLSTAVHTSNTTDQSSHQTQSIITPVTQSTIISVPDFMSSTVKTTQADHVTSSNREVKPITSFSVQPLATSTPIKQVSTTSSHQNEEQQSFCGSGTNDSPLGSYRNFNRANRIRRNIRKKNPAYDTPKSKRSTQLLLPPLIQSSSVDIKNCISKLICGNYRR